MRIVVFNPKAGVGTTTTAVNLSVALAAEGEQVVAVDLRPGGTLSSMLGQVPSVAGSSVDSSEGPSLAKSKFDGLSILVAPEEVQAKSFDPANASTEPSDWVIIDASCQAVADVAKIIAACDLVICPMEPDPNGMDQFDQMVDSLHGLGVSRNKLRILLNRYSNRLAQHRQARGVLIERYGSNLALPTVIRSSARLVEASDTSLSIFQFAPKSTGAIDFAQLARTLRAESQFAQKMRKEKS